MFYAPRGGVVLTSEILGGVGAWGLWERENTHQIEKNREKRNTESRSERETRETGVVSFARW